MGKGFSGGKDAHQIFFLPKSDSRLERKSPLVQTAKYKNYNHKKLDIRKLTMSSMKRTKIKKRGGSIWIGKKEK